MKYDLYSRGDLSLPPGAARCPGPSAQEILDQLFARLDRFVGSDRQLDDDASMVVLKVREEVMLPPLPIG
jgi:sigma-B regulation protein RsbU (phosphoserine phosphatase)